MSGFDWRAYRAELEAAEVPAYDADRMVKNVRDFVDTGNAVPALDLLRLSMLFDVTPPLPVAAFFANRIGAYFADRSAKKTLEQHLDLVTPGRSTPHLLQMRREGERRFFGKVHRLVSWAGLSAAKAIELVYRRDITRSPQPDKEPSIEALTKRWKPWRVYFQDDVDDESSATSGSRLGVVAFLSGFEGVGENGDTRAIVGRALDEARKRLEGEGGHSSNDRAFTGMTNDV